GSCDSVAREPGTIYPERTFVADRRGVELPRGRRAVHEREYFYGRIEPALRAGDFPRRLPAQGAGHDLRRAGGDVRGVRAKQVHLDRRDSMDAGPRLAVLDLASLRLLPGSSGRLFRNQEGLRAGTYPILVRR